MNTSDPIDRLREAINSHDPQRIADCFTTDYRAETPHRPQDSFVGSDHVLAHWTAILGRAPDLRASVFRRASNDDELWSEWEMTGTEPSGAPVVMRGPVIMTTRDGRIDWTRFYLSPVPAQAPSEGNATS